MNETGRLPLCPNCHNAMFRIVMERPRHKELWYFDMDLFACGEGCEPRQVAFKQFDGPGVIFFEEASRIVPAFVEAFFDREEE